MIWNQLAAALMVATGLAHSVIGERRLIGPLLAIDAPLLRVMLARRVIRFAWHLTTLLMGLCAVLVLWPAMPRPVIAVTGGLWFAAGVFDAVATRGQHIGWPLLTLAGLAALMGASA